MGWNFNQAQPICNRCSDIFPSQVQPADDPLGASVQIRMLHSSTENPPETGLGTLVASPDQTVLFTHNLWKAIDPLDRVQLLNAQGEPLAELNGKDFLALVIYRDDRNLILRSPLAKNLGAAGLRAADAINLRDTVRDTVTITYLKGESPKTIDFLTAEVKQVGSSLGVPVFQLNIKNKDVVGPIKAGSGIWLDGGFLGSVTQVFPISLKSGKRLQLPNPRQEITFQWAFDILQMLPAQLLPDPLYASGSLDQIEGLPFLMDQPASSA
jgi:hypothetical protein